MYLNHNKISTIDSLQKLLNLKTLGLFYNDLIDAEHTMSVIMKCTKLKELSIAGNECSRQPEFGYEILMRIPDLKVLDEEAVKELDLEREDPSTGSPGCWRGPQEGLRLQETETELPREPGPGPCPIFPRSSPSGGIPDFIRQT